ncbi:MAG: MFS transporter, partial [Thermoanaerobacteraceae bacterium]|nr:MFS transporter [Thermoanaerobacteraceae bacterium]
VGPALGLHLIDRIGISKLYLVTAGICAIGLAGAFFINYEKDDNPNIRSDSSPVNNRSKDEQKIHFIERNALKPSQVMFFIALAQGSVISFLPIYGYSKGISNIGIYFTVNAVALMMTRPWGGGKYYYFPAVISIYFMEIQYSAGEKDIVTF